MTDEYVAAHVQEAIAAGTHELGVRVDVRGGVVVLRGQVAAAGRCAEIEAAARAAAEGFQVRNEVSVVPLEEPAGGETLR
ncbi:BON domain-containing protein [Actinomadura parmotrematis]|uniref:BON domain-containing protein n=1 Tax=Actinomadura parmotrematis TaxID=2864039 RepID=A0ABS7FXP6_9ACTN|nr:BON domain-containing protein [Actinomadura parmotrematis]MBW8485212.1 BON domain-containing protein [Actinomadura parmotrematis]